MHRMIMSTFYQGKQRCSDVHAPSILEAVLYESKQTLAGDVRGWSSELSQKGRIPSAGAQL